MSELNQINLLPAIRALDDELTRIAEQYQIKRRELENGLKALRRINTVCEYCGGDKKILRSRACAEDDRPDPNDPSDWKKCPCCGGSGRAKYKEHEI